MNKINDTTNKIAELKRNIAELEFALNDELKKSFQNSTRCYRTVWWWN